MITGSSVAIAHSSISGRCPFSCSACVLGTVSEMVMDALVVETYASSIMGSYQDCGLMHFLCHHCHEMDSRQACAVMDILTMYAERPDLRT